MKVNFLNSAKDIPEKKENLTLLLYFKDGEVVATQDWYIKNEKYIEVYNYNKDWYDTYIIEYINKIVLLEEKTQGDE